MLILTEKAVERLGIETESVVEEEIEMTRTFGGEVMDGKVKADKDVLTEKDKV